MLALYWIANDAYKNWREKKMKAQYLCQNVLHIVDKFNANFVLAGVLMVSTRCIG